MRLAFKNGVVAAEYEDAVAAAFSRSIINVTRGKYSHVEVILLGELNNAVTFASVEPDGCRYATLNLTVSPGLWSVLEWPTTPEQDLAVNYFCAGSDGKRYDSLGIVGIGTGDGVHDTSKRFCSEFAIEACQKCVSLFAGKVRWMAAPSGYNNGQRFGLFELCIETGWKQIQ